MTTSELLAYYSALLIKQYNDKAKAIATVEALCGEVVASQIITQVLNGFDLDTAVGAQLDVLGKYRGAKRLSPGLDLSRVYFTMPDYGDSPSAVHPGFGAYGTVPTAFFKDYSDANKAAYKLTDDEMRRFIKYLAQLHISNHSLYDIDTIFFDFFGTYVKVADAGNMTATITHDATHDTDTLFKIVKFNGALPRPAGVTVTVVEI